jgi:hypothetical protein
LAAPTSGCPVATLQETGKGASDQISDLQRQLKLHSEEIGALAARVDSLEKPENPLDSQARALEGFDSLSRFGDWTTTKNDAQITLYSGTSNLAVRCSDAAPPRYFDFTAWADSNEPAAFTFLVRSRRRAG